MVKDWQRDHDEINIWWDKHIEWRQNRTVRLIKGLCCDISIPHMFTIHCMCCMHFVTNCKMMSYCRNNNRKQYTLEEISSLWCQPLPVTIESGMDIFTAVLWADIIYIFICQGSLQSSDDHPGRQKNNSPILSCILFKYGIAQMYLHGLF